MFLDPVLASRGRRTRRRGTAVLHALRQGVQVERRGVGHAELVGLAVEGPVDVVHQRFSVRDAVERQGDLEGVPAHHGGRAVGCPGARPRAAPASPLSSHSLELPAGGVGVPVIQFDPEARLPEPVRPARARFSTPSLCCAMGRMTTWVGATRVAGAARALVAVVMMIAPIMRVEVLPAGLVHVLELAVLAQVLDLERLGEVGADVPACSALPSCIMASME